MESQIACQNSPDVNSSNPQTPNSVRISEEVPGLENKTGDTTQRSCASPEGHSRASSPSSSDQQPQSPWDNTRKQEASPPVSSKVFNDKTRSRSSPTTSTSSLPIAAPFENQSQQGKKQPNTNKPKHVQGARKHAQGARGGELTYTLQPGGPRAAVASITQSQPTNRNKPLSSKKINQLINISRKLEQDSSKYFEAPTSLCENEKDIKRILQKLTSPSIQPSKGNSGKTRKPNQLPGYMKPTVSSAQKSAPIRSNRK